MSSPSDQQDLTPPGFQWIEKCLGTDADESQLDECGCRCQGDCTVEGGCSCCQRNPLGSLYDSEGRLILLVHRTLAEDTVFECSPSCGCGARCSNAITQQGGRAQLRLVQRPGKGLGVVCQQPAPAGTFVCNYVGEYITTKEAQQRLQQYDASGEGHALLVVREVLPSGEASLRVNIDATAKGNLARFFNHSCDGGNLEFVTVRHVGSLLPRVAFFASKDIGAGEELTFSYGPPNPGPGPKPCCCGTTACLGYLPHQDV